MFRGECIKAEEHEDCSDLMPGRPVACWGPCSGTNAHRGYTVLFTHLLAPCVDRDEGCLYCSMTYVAGALVQSQQYPPCNRGWTLGRWSSSSCWRKEFIETEVYLAKLNKVKTLRRVKWPSSRWGPAQWVYCVSIRWVPFSSHIMVGHMISSHDPWKQGGGPAAMHIYCNEDVDP